MNALVLAFNLWAGSEAAAINVRHGSVLKEMDSSFRSEVRSFMVLSRHPFLGLDVLIKQREKDWFFDPPLLEQREFLDLLLDR